MNVQPIPNERQMFLVESDSGESYRVDMEDEKCECELVYNRKAGIGCKHITSVKRYVKESSQSPVSVNQDAGYGPEH